MKINVGIVGAGYWGSKILQEYKLLSDKGKLNLCGVSDLSQKRLTELAFKVGLPKNFLYTDYREMLKSPMLNAVHIATPNETHYRIATEALEMGKNVLLEKPMALSSRDAFKIARLAEEQSAILLVGHIFRFSNVIVRLKDLIDKDIIGKVHYISLRWLTSIEPPKERDIVWDLAPHPVDIINYLLDEWPIRVYGRAKSFLRSKHGLEEAAFILIDLPEEKVASITLSWIQPGPKIRDLTVVGTKATAYVDAVEQEMKLYFNGTNKPKDVQIKKNNTIEAMIRHFLDRIARNDPPRNSALVGSLTVATLESVRKSLETDEPVSVVRA